MAKVRPASPFASILGKLSKRDKSYLRTNKHTGRVSVCYVDNPHQGPWSEKQTDHRKAFALRSKTASQTSKETCQSVTSSPSSSPPIQPDCCAECPLLGVIPKELRQHRSKETMVCLGTMEAMTRIGSRVRASQKDSNHKLHRPCDYCYDAWLRLPRMSLGISVKAYNECRVPYEQGQLIIKFHK